MERIAADDDQREGADEERDEEHGDQQEGLQQHSRRR